MGHFHRENVRSAGFGSESFLLDFTTNGIIQLIAYKPGTSKSTLNITKSITTQNQTKLNQAEIHCKYRGETFLPESSFILQWFPFVTLSRYILSPTMYVLYRRALPSNMCILRPETLPRQAKYTLLDISEDKAFFRPYRAVVKALCKLFCYFLWGQSRPTLLPLASLRLRDSRLKGHSTIKYNVGSIGICLHRQQPVHNIETAGSNSRL